MLPDPDDLTPAEVAKLCRRPVKTIHDWLRAGRLRGRKVGPRLWAVPRAELEAICSDPASLPAPVA
jgi:excisionase family DNA binding protein